MAEESKTNEQNETEENHDIKMQRDDGGEKEGMFS